MMNADERDAFDKLERSQEKLSAEAKPLRAIIQNLKVKNKEMETRLEHQKILMDGYAYLIRKMIKELP